MNKSTWEMIERLKTAGIKESDAFALRRIAMTLHRWHELECGIGDNATYYIERETDDETSPPHMKRSDCNGLHDLGLIPDREKGALKRLTKIMTEYPALRSYVQGDPRGASLYIMRQSDADYSNGIAVYK